MYVCWAFQMKQYRNNIIKKQAHNKSQFFFFIPLKTHTKSDADWRR